MVLIVSLKWDDQLVADVDHQSYYASYIVIVCYSPWMMIVYVDFL